MSKRTERREAERAARKLAYQRLRQLPPQQPPVAEPVQEPIVETIQPPVAASPITAAQLEANRANAQLSRGPITSQGKAISARNHTTHGLTSEPSENFVVLPCEDQTAYNQDLADFRAEWKPITATEHDLVHRLTTHQWLRRRALRLQESLFDPQTGAMTDTKKFDLYRRYETAHERGSNKALADLMRLRAFQLRQQNGFESQRRKNAEHELKMQRLNRTEELQIMKIQAASAKTQAASAKKSPSNPPNTASASSESQLLQAASP